MTEFLLTFMKGKGTYTLVGVGALAVLLKVFFHVDVTELVASDPATQDAIPSLFALLVAATFRRAIGARQKK